MGADERVVGHSEVLSKRYVELNTHGKAHSLEELETREGSSLGSEEMELGGVWRAGMS